MKKKRVAKEDNEGVEKVMEENKNVSVPEPIKNCDDDRTNNSDKGIEKPAGNNDKNNFNFNFNPKISVSTSDGQALKHKPQPTGDLAWNVTPKGVTRAETNNYLINLNSKF